MSGYAGGKAIWFAFLGLAGEDICRMRIFGCLVSGWREDVWVAGFVLASEDIWRVRTVELQVYDWRENMWRMIFG